MRGIPLAVILAVAVSTAAGESGILEPPWMSGELLWSDGFAARDAAGADINAGAAARQTGKLGPRKFVVHGRASGARLDGAGSVLLQMSTPRDPTRSNTGVVLDHDFAAEKALRIDLTIDPVTKPGGSYAVDAGLSIGLPSPQTHPSPFGNTTPMVCFTIQDGAGTMRWAVTADGKNFTVPEPPKGPFNRWNHMAHHDGPIRLRMIVVSEKDDTLVRYYVEDLVTPAGEYRIGRRLTTNYIGVFTRLGGTDAASQHTAVGELSVFRMKPDDAKRTPTKIERVLYALDLDYPGLEEVKAAMEAGDLKKAATEFSRHVRTRKAPVGPPLEPALYGTNYLEVANHALVGRYGTQGFGAAFQRLVKPNGDVDWTKDTGHMNRHFHWCSLAKAYRETRDEKYARRFAFEVRSWVLGEPFYFPKGAGGVDWIDGTRFEAGRSATGNIGRRSELTWWPAHETFKKSRSLDAEAHLLMLGCLRDQARLLMNPSSFGEWDDSGAHGAVGLLNNAIMMPEFREAKRWNEMGLQRLGRTLDGQVYEDGSHVSLSMGYCWASVNSWKNAIRILRLNDRAIPEGLFEKLEKLYEFGLAVSRPDFGMIDVNDGGWGRIDDHIRDSTTFFPDNEPIRWFATLGREGKPPAWTSRYLPNAGYFMMRTGWGKGHRYLHFDAGPVGASHGREDKLSIILDVGGKVIIPSGGRWSYTDIHSPFARYVGHTRAFNTILVDDLPQVRIPPRREIYGWTPEKRRWVTNEHFDYAEGFFTTGWHSTERNVQGKHTRQIVFVKGDRPPDTGYWVIVDTIEPADDAEHTYKAIFHMAMDGGAAARRSDKCVAARDSVELRIFPLQPRQVTVAIIKGQMEPQVQGFYCYAGRAKPIPTAIFAWKAKGLTTRAWALVPRSPGKAWPIKSVKLLSDDTPGLVQARIDRTGGYDMIVRRQKVDDPVTVERESIQGDIGVLRFRSGGRATQTLDVTPRGD